MNRLQDRYQDDICIEPQPANSGRGNTARLRRWGVLHLALVARVLLFEIRALFLHFVGRWRAKRYRNQQRLRLQFGCGDNAKPGWVNIDLSPKADLQLDLRKSLPFADGSCECTYSEHFFEHLDYPDDALFFLRENFRVLAPGGLLTFGVPDAGSALEGYARATKGAPVTPFPGHPSWVRTRMDQINFLFRQNYICQIHQHRYAYDLETLELILADVGFSQIHQREFDPLLDSESRLNGTLYVSARKS
jgi:predicted SAM-dependent methyltransferase